MQLLSLQMSSCCFVSNQCYFILPPHRSDHCDRKAKIGNCVCCVVFQVGDAVFSPEIVTSQFLHCYIGSTVISLVFSSFPSD